MASFITLPVQAAPPTPQSVPQSVDAPGDPLLQGFLDPPEYARPWTWWHWLNGNVTAEGAELDLAWMKRSGIGGVQIFEGNLGTPQLVSNRLVYMSPTWKSTFRRTVATASRLGIDVAIATSPGWSATGGPWVKSEAAMKKFVWSATDVAGGRSLVRALRSPPDVAGPFQDIPLSAIEPGADHDGPRFYRDIAAIAVRLPRHPAPRPRSITSSDAAAVAAELGDGQFGSGVKLAMNVDREAWISQDFGKPVSIRSATVGLPAARGFGAPPPASARIEASDDGKMFRPIVELPASRSPVRSAAFPATTARHFRLVLSMPQSAGVPPLPHGIVSPLPNGVPGAEFNVSEFTLDAETRINQAEEKAGFATLADYYAQKSIPTAPHDAAPVADVIDLTRLMRADGTLSWDAPPGRWRVFRFGYSLTGHQNGPAPSEATGLEVDKLSARHVRDYAEHYLGMYSDALGGEPLASAGVTALLSDSIESGPQNWTDEMPAEFLRRRGYSLLHWLPALAGVVVGSQEKSERFLWDFRRTIAELVAENHYGVLADVAKSRSLDTYAEALEDHRPQLGDDLEMRRYATIPMGAMWLIPQGGLPNPTYVADLKGASSVAHLYNRRFVAAETLTAFGQPFGYSPRDLKSTIDLAFALGVTRPVIHTSAHQPFATGHKPGLALSTVLGQFFTRNETWAEQARVWTDYLARSAFMLQQGRPQSDIAYFGGEEAPITSLYGDVPLALPAGYDFDFINRDALFNRLSPEGGDLLTDNGVRYKILVLGGSSARLTLETLKRVESLVDAGIAVVGTRPTGTPSLADDEAAFSALVARIWDKPGRVFPTVDAALAARRLSPDWDAGPMTRGLAVLHRKLEDGDLYFLSNRTGRPAETEVSFRVTGKVPELWRADAPRIENPDWRVSDGRTLVSLNLAADDAVFVLLRNSAGLLVGGTAPKPARQAGTLDENWQVSFGGDGQQRRDLHLTSLKSWTTNADAAVRYFSGTASYRRTLKIPTNWIDEHNQVLVDLGDVREIAEVWVNGKPCATLWHPPFRTNLSPCLRAGANTLEVRVTNLWVNRLIGDAQPGSEKITFTQTPTYTADAPLRPSGLLGPVTMWLTDRD